ncbi:hypothetical protein, partial [Sphingomonas sp. DT-204]|uniref:hypothetical protein n=1 Tax=Sphingomonas sp. DT-204 TaxID=3396166 RepID=UPI003F1D5E13
MSRTDLGGHVFASSYDQAGRLTGVSGNGASTSYGYYNTGLAATVTQTDTAGTTVTDYGYDARGLKTSEHATLNGAVIQDASAAYDALGRMTVWAESGSGWSDPTKGAPAASVLWQYDAAGNIRSRKASYHVITDQGAASSSLVPS